MAQCAAMIGGMMMFVLQGDGRELCGGERTDHEQDDYYLARRMGPSHHLKISISKIKRGPGRPSYLGETAVGLSQTLITFSACRPLGPCFTSNSTSAPSSRVR